MNWQDIALWVGPALLVLWLVWFLWSNREAAHMRQAILETNADLGYVDGFPPPPPPTRPRGFMQAAGKHQVGTPIKPGGVFEFTEDPEMPPKVYETYRLNRDKSVAVATDYYTNPDMSQCPRGVKLILIGKGGVGTIAIYDGDPFWIEWAPMPKRGTGSSTG